MQNAEKSLVVQPSGDKPQNIHDRALSYGVRAIRFFRFLQKSRDVACQIVGKQYLRSATSIGANLSEAHAAETRADFIHKCSIAQKEARECLYWLKLIAAAELVTRDRLQPLIVETGEIVAVITTIAKNARRRSE